MSQEALAEQLGVHPTPIIRCERGLNSPQPRQRPTLARALKVSVEELEGLLVADDEAQLDDSEQLNYSSPGKPTRQMTNRGLDVLIRGAGHGSLESFAQ